jgi:coenzyme F420 hydrogenase subunit beta
LTAYGASGLLARMAISPDHLSIAFTDKTLCTRCGTCAGVCPTGAITMGDDLYPVIDEDACIDCGLCTKTCPGGTVEYKHLTQITFGHDHDTDSFDGHVRETFVGKSTDPEIQARGAGGGIITGLLADLLEHKVVDGCIVTRMKPDQPWRGEAFIARTRTELLQSQGSRYMIIPVNEVFALLRREQGRFALAALPCQMHGYRLMQEACPELAGKIHLAIGLFCGGSLEPEVVTDLLKTKHLGRDDINGFEFRGGEWPGKMRALLKNDTIRDMHYSNYKDGAYNYLISLYMPPRCQTCLDGSGEFSDLSVSDAWTRDREGNYKFKGHSRILVRTERGAKALDDAVEAGAITTICVSDDPSYRTHRIQTRRKGVNAPLRVARLKKAGRAVPTYDRDTPDHTKKDVIKERVISGLIGLSRFPRLRFLVIKFLTSSAAIPLIKLRLVLKKRKYQKLKR